MYSVVLMMALTTGTDAVDFGHRNRCHGCSGGYGGYACSGYGGYGGCYGGYGRHGCHGGYGGYGGCSGYYGGGCSGYYGGGGYGGGCSGYYGGGCTGGYGGFGGCTGGYGCAGGYGGGVIMAPGGGMQPEPLKTPPKKSTTPQEAFGPAPATILVTLPASAKLTIDGSPTTSTSGTRTLISPPLERGNTYVYTLRAELNGQTQSQDIRVRPGEITQAQFTFPTAAVAGR